MLCYQTVIITAKSGPTNVKKNQQNNNKDRNDTIYFRVTMCQMLTLYHIPSISIEGTDFHSD